MGSGDVVARLIGDTARIKAGLKGFLIHVATNGLLLAGVTVVLLCVNVALGAVFVVAGLLVGALTVWGACSTYHTALRFRRREGKLAGYIQNSWMGESLDRRFESVNRSSGQHEARLTRIQGIVTWGAHIVLGAAVVVALGIGVRAVTSGHLAAGDVLVVMMYALMLRGPIVQLARQGARTGKIVACAQRVQRLLSASDRVGVARSALTPLRERIELTGVRVTDRRPGGSLRRLGPIDLRIARGQRIAVIGLPGSGKTTLLETIAGMHAIRSGEVLWDGVDLATYDGNPLLNEIALLPQMPTWSNRRVVGAMRRLDERADAEDPKELSHGCESQTDAGRSPRTCCVI